MSNEKVIERFLERETGKTGLRDILNGCYTYKGRTLESTGDELINYSTVIAYFTDDNKLMINKKKYSCTTSKIQSKLRYLASENGLKYEEYEG